MGNVSRRCASILMSRWFAPVFLLALTLPAVPVSADTPVVDPADACTVVPRTVDNIERLVALATPTSGSELEPYVIASSSLPVGDAASTATIDEIATVLVTRAACLRDLDALRTYALYTDRYLISLFAVEGYPVLDWSPGTPAPSPDYWLGSVDQPLLLEDGRVSALATFVGNDIEDSHPRPGVTYLMVFEQVEGTWRIDHQYQGVLDEATQRLYPVADLLDDLATPAS